MGNIFLLFLILTTSLKAGYYDQLQKIVSSDIAINDRFGNSVALDGNCAIVGAYNDDDKGSAYIYNFDGSSWVEVTKIVASDGEVGDNFGWSVSISGNYAIVGACYDDDNGEDSGSAYIFSKDQGGENNWGEIKKITPADGDANDNFSLSVYISDQYAIVGAYGDDDNGDRSGSAYIYSKDQGGVNNWGEVKKITASDGAALDIFGISVSISGNIAIVGAYCDQDNGYRSGSVYIYNRDQGGANNWGEIKKIKASDGSAEDYFGFSVSINGDHILIGAYGDDDNGSESGSAYIYNKDQGGENNWGEVKKITASDGESGDWFSRTLSIDGDYIIVGAYFDDNTAVNSGSAYIYNKDLGGENNWGEVKKITASDGDTNDYFGTSVSISGVYAIVGADNQSDSGATYIYGKSTPILDNSGDMVFNSITEDDSDPTGEVVSVLLSSDLPDPITDLDGDPEGIAIISTSGDGVWEYFNGSEWGLVGSVDEKSALLLLDSYSLKFKPNLSFNNAQTATIIFRAWDQSSGNEEERIDVSENGNLTPFSSATEIISLEVLGINDPPINGNAPNITYPTTIRIGSTVSGEKGSWSDPDN